MTALMETEERFPFPEKFYKYERRYFFSKRPNSKQLIFAYRSATLSDFPRTHETPFCNLLSACKDRKVEKSEFPLTKLPDVVLLEVFGCLHPLDRIHCVSKVCRKWSVLARAPSLFKEVRVFLGGEAFDNGAAKAFLKRISRHVVRLCLEARNQFWAGESVLTSDQVTRILPKCMPSVKILDFNYLDDLTAELFDKMVECFPNIESLRLVDLNTDSSSESNKTDCFRHLRHLNISSADVAQGLFAKVVIGDRQPLETLLVAGRFPTEFPETLTELRVSHIDGPALHAICKNLRNLRVLSCATFSSLPQLRLLKNLWNIEHLHLQLYPGPSFTDLPEQSEEYRTAVLPSTIKHLRLNCSEITTNLAEALVNSCPDLETLGINGTSLSSGSFSVLANNLRSLRFFDISRCGLENCEILQEMTSAVGDRLLPQLRYLQCSNTRVDKRILQKICIRRKRLMLMRGMFQFLTFRMKNGEVEFDDYSGDWDSIIDHLENEEEGFCCMSTV